MSAAIVAIIKSGERPIQTQVGLHGRLESHAVTAHLPRFDDRQIGCDDRQLRRKRCLGDGLIHRPVRPTAVLPIHRRTQARGIAWRARQVVGDGAGVVEAEHLETNGGPAAGGDQAAQHLGLQPVVVRIVVLLAEEHEVGASQTDHEAPVIDEFAGRHVPDAASERMVAAVLRLPGGNRARRQQCHQHEPEQIAPIRVCGRRSR